MTSVENRLQTLIKLFREGKHSLEEHAHRAKRRKSTQGRLKRVTMKLNSSVPCVLLLLFHTHILLAKRGGGGGGGKGGGGGRGGGSGFKKILTTNTNAGSKNKGSGSHGGNPKQHGQNKHGGYPPRSGDPGYPGSYPRQQGGGGYHYQHPGRGSPYGGAYGGYGGGYINHNPNNKILSPHYGGSFGYGGYGSRGGSPFSRSVQTMGIHPNVHSKGFGRTAVMAAAGGAVAGMALGYGLGRFPRPHFQFHSPQDEYYYNHYMYRKYGSRSSDSNDYSRDYRYSPPPQTYDSYMDSCMKRKDLFPEETQKAKNKPATSTTTTTEMTNNNVATLPSDNNTESNTTNGNSTAVQNTLSSSPLPPRTFRQQETRPIAAEDDDTVSIMEIGYPSLINQMKVRRCLELYMAYSEKYLTKTGRAQGLNTGFQGLLAFVLGTIVMAVNSNMIILFH